MARKDIHLKAVVGCVDKLSPALDKQSKRCKTLERDLKALSRASANVGRSAFGVFDDMISMGAKAAGMFGVSIGGAITSFSSFAAQIDAASSRLGIGVEDLQRYQYWAAKNGSSAETMTSGLEHLNKVMAEAATGKNKDAQEMFAKLGISLRGTNGQVKSATEILPQLAEAVRLNEDPATQLRIVMAAFGKTGQELLPTLRSGSDGLREFSNKADGFAVSSASSIKAGEKIASKFEDVKSAATTASGIIAEALEPSISKAADSTTEWVSKNKDLIRTNVSEWAEVATDAFKAIPWDAVLAGIGALVAGKTILKLADLTKAFVDLGKAMKPFVTPLMTAPVAVGAGAAVGAVALYNHANKHGKNSLSEYEAAQDDAGTLGMGLSDQSIFSNRSLIPQFNDPNYLNLAAQRERMEARLHMTFTLPDGTETTRNLTMKQGATVSGDAGVFTIGDDK